MREEYLKLIREKQIQDSLSWIEDMPYSRKIAILEDLLKVYEIKIINRSLAQYEDRYIKAHRVVPVLVRNILVSLCKANVAKDENEKN